MRSSCIIGAMMLWLKTFHLLFVIAWMAGVFYLPRILVHYLEGTAAQEDTRRLVIMAERLFWFSVVMAGMVFITGFWLWLGYGVTGDWLYAKLFFVLLLLIYQAQTLRYIARMKAGNLLYNSLFFRLFNEAALILLVPILILAVMKPF